MLRRCLWPINTAATKARTHTGTMGVGRGGSAPKQRLCLILKQQHQISNAEHYKRHGWVGGRSVRGACMSKSTSFVTLPSPLRRVQHSKRTTSQKSHEEDARTRLTFSTIVASLKLWECLRGLQKTDMIGWKQMEQGGKEEGKEVGRKGQQK